MEATKWRNQMNQLKLISTNLLTDFKNLAGTLDDSKSLEFLLM